VSVAAPPVTALYARISDDRGTEAQGVERQLEDCRALAAERGWLDLEEYRDDGYSASMYASRPRPAYVRLLADVRAGRIGRIVVWALDRLYRKPVELEDLVSLFTTGCEVEVIAVRSGSLDLNTPSGRLAARTFSTMAAYESDATSMRVTREKDSRRARGLPHGGRVPVGWRDMVTPDPTEAALLRESMEAVVSGATLYDLATRWNASTVRRHGAGASSLWTGSELRRLLANPRHCGLVADHGGIAVDAEGREIPATWPAIVSRDLWAACRAVLTARATGTNVPRRRAWLTGVLRCGAPGCGASLTQSSVRPRPGARRTMLWRHSGCVSVRAALIEPLIVEALFQYVDGPELRDALAARDDGRVAEIRLRLVDVERRQRELVDEFREGGTAHAFRLASEALEHDRSRLEVELGKASARSPLEDYGDRPGALSAAWPTMTVDQKRATVLAAFGQITIAPTTTRGRWFDSERISFGARPLTP
jgi:site-specific DNA recombinase